MLAACFAVIVWVGSTQAHAAITPTTDPNALASAMLQSPGVLTGAAFEALPPDARSAASSNEAIAGFPSDGGSFGVLSTGDVAAVSSADTASDTGTNLGGVSQRGSAEQDVTILRLDVNVPSGVNCLSNMDFRFLSEEYPEFVGSAFNDAFIAEVDQSTWTTSGSTITADRNFAFDPAGNPITVNAAGVTSMTADEGKGTTFDGATPRLQAATPITPGAHRIYLSIFDIEDGVYDSAVMIDNIRFAKVANVSRDCKPGAEIVNTRRYVALGDSYSSGFGVPDFQPGTHGDNGPNDCQRSDRAYSKLVAAHYDLSLDFKACQGALTKDFYEGRTRDASWGEAPQLTHLNPETGLVTFSIGGNDAQFVPVVLECALGFELLPFNTCYTEDKVLKPVAEAFDRLAGKTQTPADITPYDRIFKDARLKAPYATRVVVGYPEFFAENGGDRTFLPGGRCEAIKKADQRWMVQQIRKLNSIIATAARKNGFRYADPGPQFKGRELCGGKEEWIGGAASSARFHPTAEGHNALAQAVIAALDDPDAEGGAYTVKPGDTVTNTFTIPLGQERVTIVAQWPGSDVPLTIVSPSGVRYTRDSPGAGVVHDVGPTWEQYEIPSPEAGDWRFELFGKTVGPGGEQVTVQPTIEAPANALPTATITRRKNRDGTTTLSSTRSSDPDGQIIRREWYVSAGKSETYSRSKTVKLPRRSNGRSVSLLITDNRGEISFASVKQPDRLGPKITKLVLQRSIRRGGRTIWIPTKRLQGNVRVRLDVNEPGVVSVKLAGMGKTSKTKTRRTAGGRVLVNVRALTSGLRPGKVTLTLAATDASRNASSKKLTVRR